MNVENCMMYKESERVSKLDKLWDNWMIAKVPMPHICDIGNFSIFQELMTSSILISTILIILYIFLYGRTSSSIKFRIKHQQCRGGQSALNQEIFTKISRVLPISSSFTLILDSSVWVGKSYKTNTINNLTISWLQFGVEFNYLYLF